MVTGDVICDVVVEYYGKEARHKYNIDNAKGLGKFVSAIREFTKNRINFAVICTEEY